MTICGALSDLDNLLKADDIPCYYKPSIKAVMDTVKLSSSEKPNYTDDEIQKMQDLEFAEIQKAYEIGKDESSSENPNKWIPVSERLPEEDGKYYVTLENECVKILGYATVQTLRYPKGFYYVTDDGIAWRQTINPVIAWMPLPLPYKQEVEE